MLFNGERLRVLRQFHGFTLKELGALIGSTSSTIRGYESGSRVPRGLALDALSECLGVNPLFFSDFRLGCINLASNGNFRSLVSTTDKMKGQVSSFSQLFGFILSKIGEKVVLPNPVMPRIRASNFEEIEKAAEECRIAWGVGCDQPILSVTHMLEHAGIIVTELNKAIDPKIDAFSCGDEVGLIILNPAKKSSSRRRMDLAHEAGHLVLHSDSDISPDSIKVREEQAKYFAGALLLPRKAFSLDFWNYVRPTDWDGLVMLKKRWGVSLAAIVFRAKHLGLIDSAEYLRRYKHMAYSGWLKREPAEPEMEYPQLFKMMLDRYEKEESGGLSKIPESLFWSTKLFECVTGIDIPAQSYNHPDAAAFGVTSIDEFRKRKAVIQ